MKILFVISGLSAGGAQRSLLSLCEEFVKFKNCIIFICTWLKSDDKYIVPEDINIINFALSEPYCYSKLNYLKSIYQIRKAIKNVSPDYVVAVQCNIFPRVLCANIGFDNKLLVWEHTSMSRKMDKEGEIARKYLYKYADGVIVLTTKDAEYIKGRYKKIYTLPNSLPFPINRNNSKRKNIVIAVGRLDVWHIKGFDSLIHMWSSVYEEIKNWQLYIVGEGNSESTEYLKKVIESNGLSESIILTGYRNDIPELLQRSKIFVLPSRIEGFPMGLIEAMSQGCACISFSIDNAVSDIIKDGEDGIIVQDRNEKLFVEYLTNLMRDDKIRNYLSQNAVRNISRFNKQSIAHKWIEILNHL